MGASPYGSAWRTKEAVQALRFNEARRCAAPLRLDALPAGAKVTACSVGVASYPRLITAHLTLQRPDHQVMWVRYQYLSTAGTSTRANRTVGGRPAFLSPNGTTLELVGIKGTTAAVDFGLPQGSEDPPSRFTEADATVLLAGARIATDPIQPDSW
ncbi:hypothetical protein ACIA47_19070 [Micromonospora sp. NPDC051227]|uniref:hypothetical protein n=1 Tax=Micromonospora sp. NPDC051227 TaxID=3364285 RepID=UPI0037AC992E